MGLVSLRLVKSQRMDRVPAIMKKVPVASLQMILLSLVRLEKIPLYGVRISFPPEWDGAGGEDDLDDGIIDIDGESEEEDEDRDDTTVEELAVDMEASTQLQDTTI